MSVYGEYSRALETLIEAIRPTEFSDREALIAKLEDARVGGTSDLTRGARCALEALTQLEATNLELPSHSTPAPSARGQLEAAREHLRAHCRAVLGV